MDRETLGEGADAGDVAADDEGLHGLPFHSQLEQIHKLVADGAIGDLMEIKSSFHFFQLSIAATAEPLVTAGVLSAAEAAGLVARRSDPGFLGCGFAHIAAWGRRR